MLMSGPPLTACPSMKKGSCEDVKKGSCEDIHDGSSLSQVRFVTIQFLSFLVSQSQFILN